MASAFGEKESDSDKADGHKKGGGETMSQDEEVKNKERRCVSDCEEGEPASGGSGDRSLIKVLSPQAVRSEPVKGHLGQLGMMLLGEVTLAFISSTLSTGSAVYRTYMTIDP